jgi:DNA-binding NarL/FixJ family response regulator
LESDAVSDREIHVWVVEDNELLRATLEEVLDREPGVRCTLAAPSAEVALQALAEGDVPEVVLMDLGLPGMDGVEGIRRLRVASPASQIVVLTVHEDNERIFDAMCAGASGYLLKPADTESISDAVRSVLNGGAPINARIARRVLGMFTGRLKPRGDYGLTRREHEILELLTEGQSQKRIARTLEISTHTVDTHLRNIYGKLQVHSRTAAVAKALKERLI